MTTTPDAAAASTPLSQETRAAFARNGGLKAASNMSKRQLVARARKASEAGRKSRARCKHRGTDRYVLRARKKIVVTAATPAEQGEQQYCRFCARKV